jgi:CheY-like chemotaxis protein
MEKQRVLLAHGNADCRKIYGMVLAVDGYSVDVAEDMPAALAQLKSSRYDAVITDLYLIADDGDECLIRLMRASPTEAHLPVIVLTGWTTEAHQQLAMSFGADRFLSLPIRPRELSSVLADVLGPPPRPTVPVISAVKPQEHRIANGF